MELQTRDLAAMAAPCAGAVLLALTSQGGPLISRLRVDAEDGLVTVRGYVESHGQRYLAHRQVERVPGGRQVRLLLAVLCD